MDKQKGSAVAVDDKAKKDEAKYDQIAQKELQETNLLLQQFEISLKRGTYQRSHELATKTLLIIEKYIQSSCWKNADEVLKWLDSTSTRLKKAAVSESAPTNMIQRLRKIIKEEFVNRKKTASSEDACDGGSQMSTSRLDSVDSGMVDFSEEVPDLRSDILNAILELDFELESSAENISEDAEKHIHSNEVILTVGKSRTVQKFLTKAASNKTRFDVIVTQCGPFYTGTEMAETLKKKHKLRVTVIDDTAAFSVMSRVHKVIIGTHTILANGGLKAIAGCHPVLLAAKYYNVPVIVLAPLYKLSPEYPLSNNVKITNRFVSPELLVEFQDLLTMEDAHIYAPVFDYVPPELITLFIFNIGSHSPSYIYRLLHDTYPQLE